MLQQMLAIAMGWMLLLAVAVPTEGAATTQQGIGPEMDVPLAGKVTASCAGGGGNWLVFKIDDNQQLVIYDVEQGKVLGSIPIADTDFEFAATKSKLFVGLKGLKQLQRWDLQTQKLEQTVPAPQGGVSVLAAAAGADGPVVLAGNKRLWSIDPRTLSATRFESKNWGTDGSAGGPASVSVAFDGSAVAAAGGGWAGIEFSNIFDARVIAENSDLRSASSPIVSGDGLLVLSASGILRADSNVPVSGIEGDAFPAEDRAFSLALVKPQTNSRVKWQPANVRQSKEISLVLFNNADPRPMVTLHDLPELAESSEMPTSQRVYLIPRLGKLITLGKAANQLIVRTFDLKTILESMGTPYLVVKSSPPVIVKSGQVFNYKPEVLSKAGGVTFNLQTAPPGMKVGADGAIGWAVPQNFPEADAAVILQIGDASGKTVFQNFRIRVAGQSTDVASNVPSKGKASPPTLNPSANNGIDASQTTVPAPSTYPTNLTLNLGELDAGVTHGLRWRSGLVLQKNRLSRVAADGITLVEHWDLDKEYARFMRGRLISSHSVNRRARLIYWT